jgi:hypothetical protein
MACNGLAISLSSVGHVALTGEGEGSISTVGSFIANLPELFGQIARDSRSIVAIANFSDNRYVQFRADSDGRVAAEVVSNANIKEAVPLTPPDEIALLEAGWQAPSDDESRPNWRVQTTDSSDIGRIITMIVTAIYTVLRERPSSSVTIRTFAMTTS